MSPARRRCATRRRSARESARSAASTTSSRARAHPWVPTPRWKAASSSGKGSPRCNTRSRKVVPSVRATAVSSAVRAGAVTATPRRSVRSAASRVRRRTRIRSGGVRRACAGTVTPTTGNAVLGTDIRCRNAAAGPSTTAPGPAHNAAATTRPHAVGRCDAARYTPGATTTTAPRATRLRSAFAEIPHAVACARENTPSWPRSTVSRSMRGTLAGNCARHGRTRGSRSQS